MSRNQNYWTLSIATGTIGTVFMFMILPVMEPNRTPPNIPVIKVNFIEWQEPAKPKKKKVYPPKQKVQPKQKIKQLRPVKKLKRVVPPEQVEPEPAIVKPPLEPIPHFKLTTMPRFVHLEKPVYPPLMRRMGREGMVKLEVLIDATGAVRKITVIKSAGDQFDKAAIAAVKASAFVPGNIEGKPVTTLLRLPVTFKLL